MVIEVFESARRPKCHVTASIRHVRRLESARTPKKAPPSAQTAQAKRAFLSRQERGFKCTGNLLALPVRCSSVALPSVPNPRATGRCAPKNSRFAQKTKNKSPGGIEQTTTRRPQQITVGSETMGLTVPLKEFPCFPHLLVIFVVVWHVFAYQVSSQCATPVPWGGAWAPGVSGCQHTQPAQKKAPGGALGPFGGNPSKIGSLSSAATFHYSPLGWRIEMTPIFGFLGPFLLVRPVSAKTATFWPRSHQAARLTAQRDGNRGN